MDPDQRVVLAVYSQSKNRQRKSHSVDSAILGSSATCTSSEMKGCEGCSTSDGADAGLDVVCRAEN